MHEYTRIQRRGRAERGSESLALTMGNWRCCKWSVCHIARTTPRFQTPHHLHRCGKPTCEIYGTEMADEMGKPHWTGNVEHPFI
jgi:hypothetical protein